MKKVIPVLVLCALLSAIFACNFPGENGDPEIEEAVPLSGESSDQDTSDTESETAAEPVSEQPPPDIDIEQVDLIQPDDLVYIGAFRLPDLDGDNTWQYSGQGLTYYPSGDPQGSDGYTGSLFGFGHDQFLQVSEISIPVPVISTSVEELNTAEILQPFADISGGIYRAQDMVIPVAGLEYLPAQQGQTSDKLYFTFGQHLQYFETSHGWSELDLAHPQAAGPWNFGSLTNYISNDYIFEIPFEWAETYTPGQRLASGRFREGLWGGAGPTLFAYAPWLDGNPPPADATLETITPLLLYGTPDTEFSPDTMVFDETMQMNGYQRADHWYGGSWLTADSRSAVIFTGTKALERSWYGFANGVVFEWGCDEQDPPTCPEVPAYPYDNRGFWAEDYEAQIIFFSPSELAAVAVGQIDTWEPQPYATMSIQEYLFDPELDVELFKRDFMGACAFDRENGRLFIFERLVRQDDSKSIIHVFEIQ